MGVIIVYKSPTYKERGLSWFHIEMIPYRERGCLMVD